MKVFKFGGASVKEAEAVRNVGRILEQYRQEELWVVVSAMGKTTNALESLLEAYRFEFDNRRRLLQSLKNYHEEILTQLFPFGENEVWTQCATLFKQLESSLEKARGEKNRASYSEVVSYGELLSTRIVSAYLSTQGTPNEWIDARQCIMTENRLEEAQVNMESTKKKLLAMRESSLASRTSLSAGEQVLFVTQGFIGSHEQKTTSLGREGSDYTAGLLAWSLDASELSIWKDVPGMLNADPKYFPDAEIIEELSYKEAIELSYYGASIIHPKTIKPLQNKQIPLYVRSFVNPELPGTRIHVNEKKDAMRASYIFKQNMVLLSIIPNDFSFIMEENMSTILGRIAQHGLRADLIQNSALSFSICLEDKGAQVDELRASLSRDFKVFYNQGLSLFTIRHYREKLIQELLNNREILVEQRSRHTARFVVKGGFRLSSES